MFNSLAIDKMQIKTSHIRTVKRKNIEAIKGWQ
jgi:hypothetical protein